MQRRVVNSPAIALRPLEPADCEAMVHWIESEDALYQWSGPWDFTWPLNPEQLVRDLQASGEHRFAFAALDGRDELVGHAMLTVHRRHGMGLIGRVLIDPGRRGRGLGTDLVREVVRTGFGRFGLHRLQLGVYDFNAAAIACYRRLGFAIEGTLRDSARSSQGYWSSHIMGLLEDEYRQRLHQEGTDGDAAAVGCRAAGRGGAGDGAAGAGRVGAGVRTARSDDAEAVAALLDELGYPCGTEQARARLVDWASDDRGVVLVAEHDGEPAGVAAVYEIRSISRADPFARVLALAVAERARRSGIGRGLLRAAEEWARARGATELEITSRRTRAEAQAFYRALGFEDVCGRSARFRRAVPPSVGTCSSIR